MNLRGVRVKICGITNWPDAKRAVDSGASLLGFNFYSRSPRYITPAKARRIVRRLPKSVLVVGVFVNEAEEKMLEVARVVGLDFVQLHGDEPPATIARLKRMIPVIKAIRVRKPLRTAQLARYHEASALLLDGFDRHRRGGTGKTFDWKCAQRVNAHARIFLAGGLTSENIAEAIRVAKPYGVDLCSGVESRPGKKDPARLRAVQRALAGIQGKK